MFLAMIVTVPPSGMASRALTTRLTSAISSSPTSTMTGHTSGAISISSLTPPPRPLVSTSRIDSIRCADVDRLRIDPLAPGERQQLARQRRAALGRELDRLRGARGLRILRRDLLQGMDVAGHDHQQIVEVVRHAAGELAERIHLLGFGELLLQPLERHLRLAALGDVAGDLGKADQLAVIVADRIDDHAGPEERAVLADAPALLLVAAGFPGDRRARAPAGRRPGPRPSRSARNAGR